MRDFLEHRLGAHLDVDAHLASGRFVASDGRLWRGEEPYRGNTFVWFHRGRRPEPPVPTPLVVLHSDERIVVVDKPHFLATTPRGTHATESVVAKLRLLLGNGDLVPAHRLDRLTAGVLLLTTQRRYRAAYAGLFATGAAAKTYEAIAPFDPAQAFPHTLTGRVVKRRDRLQADLVEGEPNASTRVELIETRGGYARYRLTPATGKTHQLRLQLADLGLGIVGDPLYPQVRDVDPDDFTEPLRLVARRLEFTDPVDGSRRDYASRTPLTWPDGTVVAD
jgi:tRNA pseudouridine32 synthase/23S rRNA pseudouridine746 synthase